MTSSVVLIIAVFFWNQSKDWAKDESFIKKESAHIKRQRAELENEIVKLANHKSQIESLDKVSEQVTEYCANVVQKLDGFGFDDKRLALKALQVKVVVGKSGVKLFGLIPDFNATIERTSARRRGYNYLPPPDG